MRTLDVAPDGKPEYYLAPADVTEYNAYITSGPPGGTREIERYLPIANVSRIMKRVLPESAKVSKDTKDNLQEAVSEFICFLTSEASDRCSYEKRKTISGDDILWAMDKLGFDKYSHAMRIYIRRFNEQMHRPLSSPAGDSELPRRGPPQTLLLTLPGRGHRESQNHGNPTYDFDEQEVIHYNALPQTLHAQQLQLQQHQQQQQQHQHQQFQRQLPYNYHQQRANHEKYEKQYLQLQQEQFEQQQQRYELAQRENQLQQRQQQDQQHEPDSNP